MILMVTFLLSFLLTQEVKAVEQFSYTYIDTEQLLPSASSFNTCNFDLLVLSEDADLEKDVEDDGSFSKDLDGGVNFEFEITPLPHSTTSRFNFAHLLGLEKTSGYTYVRYPTPYLKYDHPPKIA